jgi:hypothetical protein
MAAVQPEPWLRALINNNNNKTAAKSKLSKYHSNTRARLSKINLPGIEVLLCGVG